MKKFTMIIAAVAMLVSNGAFAQTNSNSNMGKGAAAGSNAGSNHGMAWLVGVGALGVVATAVGLTASSASSSPSTFSH